MHSTEHSSVVCCSRGNKFPTLTTHSFAVFCAVCGGLRPPEPPRAPFGSCENDGQSRAATQLAGKILSPGTPSSDQKGSPSGTLVLLDRATLGEMFLCDVSLRSMCSGGMCSVEISFLDLSFTHTSLASFAHSDLSTLRIPFGLTALRAYRKGSLTSRGPRSHVQPSAAGPPARPSAGFFF